MNKDALIQAIGERLAKERQAKGWTLEELSKRTGISRANLNDAEHGKRDSRISTLAMIAKGLGIALSKLLKGL